jgi:hypothetical protein
MLRRGNDRSLYDCTMPTASGTADWFIFNRSISIIYSGFTAGASFRKKTVVKTKPMVWIFTADPLKRKTPYGIPSNGIVALTQQRTPPLPSLPKSTNSYHSNRHILPR